MAKMVMYFRAPIEGEITEVNFLDHTVTIKGVEGFHIETVDVELVSDDREVHP